MIFHFFGCYPLRYNLIVKFQNVVKLVKLGDIDAV